MSNVQIAVFAAAAILVFWMVGAYNRLVALRNAIALAWATVDDVLRARGAAVQQLVLVLREPMVAEQGALDALLAAERQVRAAADGLSSKPARAELAAALVAGEAAMASAASRALALLEQHDALRADPEVAPHALALRDSVARLVFARQLYNDAAQAYNAAVRLFPTRLLAELYRFGAAGRL